MKRLIEKIRNLAPVMDTQYRIGMRVVKTAAAVMICLIIALLAGSMESVPIATVSAIVTIRATQGETVRTAVFRVLGTIIGGALGMLTVVIGLFLPYYYDGLFVLVIPLMLILNLYLCNVLNLQDSCTISCVVTIMVAAHIELDATVQESLLYTLLRLRDTFIGVVVATIMNIVPYHVAGIFKK